MLARREHSAAEIRQKLQKRGFDSDEIDQAIIELQQGDWQSDERFAEAYIRGRRLKGFGPVRISVELRERGVDESIIEQNLSASDDVWLQTMHDEYQRKYHGKDIRDYQEKAKRMRFLQYRGFTSDMIQRLLQDRL